MEKTPDLLTGCWGVVRRVHHRAGGWNSPPGGRGFAASGGLFEIRSIWPEHETSFETAFLRWKGLIKTFSNTRNPISERILGFVGKTQCDMRSGSLIASCNRLCMFNSLNVKSTDKL